MNEFDPYSEAFLDDPHSQKSGLLDPMFLTRELDETSRNSELL